MTKREWKFSRGQRFRGLQRVQFKAADQCGWETHWSPGCGQGLEGPRWRQIHPSLRWVWKRQPNPFDPLHTDSCASIRKCPAYTHMRSQGLGGICAVWELLRSAFQGKKASQGTKLAKRYLLLVSHLSLHRWKIHADSRLPCRESERWHMEVTACYLLW